MAIFVSQTCSQVEFELGLVYTFKSVHVRFSPPCTFRKAFSPIVTFLHMYTNPSSGSHHTALVNRRFDVRKPSVCFDLA